MNSRISDKKDNEEKTSQELKLEKIGGRTSIKWVKEQNKKTLTFFQKSSEINESILEIPEKIFNFSGLELRLDSEFIYTRIFNTWKKTTFAKFGKDRIKWTTVTNNNNVPGYNKRNKQIIQIKYDKHINAEWGRHPLIFSPNGQRALVKFSLPETNISVFREYDIAQKEFVKSGFQLPPTLFAYANWHDDNSIIVSANFGKDSLNANGYPRLIKLWRRGDHISDAKTLVEGKESDRFLNGKLYKHHGQRYHFVFRYISYEDRELYLINSDASLTRVPIPTNSRIKFFFGGHAIVLLTSEWNPNRRNNFKTGSLVAFDLQSLNHPRATLIFEPTETCAFNKLKKYRNCLMLTILNNVSDELHRVSFKKGAWIKKLLPLPDKGSFNIIAAAKQEYLISYQNFLTSPTFYYCNSKTNTLRTLKSVGSQHVNMETKQFFAKSLDGTQIPYFVIQPKDLKYDGTNPTLLYGYGGFGISGTPKYLDKDVRKLWLEQGGVYVSANIRGGVEFGTQWHTSVLKENRHKIFEDFIAVAEDLIERKITSPKHLGIEGASNGGLLVGAAFTMRPDLFNAVISVSPLLNMLDYNKYADANKAWIVEYGNPDDPDLHQVLKQYSPYHNVSENKKYPEVLFMTSTNDKTVHPAHVRNMVDKMQTQGHTVYYYEGRKGGHGLRENDLEDKTASALKFGFLKKQLMDNKLRTLTLFKSGKGCKRKASEAELESNPQERNKILKNS